MSQEKLSEAERKRRLRERVFGNVLPETTTDESRDEESRDSNEDELRRNVPPHHG